MWKNDMSCYRITVGSTQQGATLELTKDEMESINEWFATYGVEQNAKDLWWQHEKIDIVHGSGHEFTISKKAYIRMFGKQEG